MGPTPPYVVIGRILAGLLLLAAMALVGLPDASAADCTAPDSAVTVQR